MTQPYNPKKSKREVWITALVVGTVVGLSGALLSYTNYSCGGHDDFITIRGTEGEGILTGRYCILSN